MNKILVCLVVILLTGCATPPKPPPSYAELLGQAKSIEAANDIVATKQAYKRVTQAYPDEIEPWQQLAQMEFNARNYSDAIVYAKRAMQISPEDSLSNSIISVSGLRLSAHALGVLRRNNKLEGNVRSEANVLADVLRSNLQVEEIVPTEKEAPVKKVKKKKRKIKKRISKRKEKTKPQTGGSNDPFASLE